MSYPIALLNDPPPPTYPEYTQLWAAAQRTAPRFVDAANSYRGAAAAQRRGPDWCTAVLGFPYQGLRHLTVVQDQLLALADEAGVDPPLPDWIVQAQAEGERRQAARDQARRGREQRDADTWREVLELTTVELQVREGSRPRVRGGSSEYLRHVIPVRDVYSGTRTIRTHPAGRALCESPRRARPLALGATSDAPATCVRCLQWAPKVRATAGGDPGTTPAQRAAQLIEEIERLGRILEFVTEPATGRANAVHVVGPDEDQPGYESVAEYLATRRFRVVCGRTIRLRPLDGTVGVFDDHLLCMDCHAAFGDHAGLIFEHNTEDWQAAAPATNQRIRAGKAIAADGADASRAGQRNG